MTHRHQDKRVSIYLKALFTLSSAFKLGLVIYLIVTEHGKYHGYAQTIYSPTFTVALAEFPGGATTCTISSFPAWEFGILDWFVIITDQCGLMSDWQQGSFQSFSGWYSWYCRPSKGLNIGGSLSASKALHLSRCSYEISWCTSCCEYTGFRQTYWSRWSRSKLCWCFLSVISCCKFAIISVMLHFSNYFVGNIFGRLGSPSFLSLLGSRMLFNLKDAGERGQNPGTSYRTVQGTMGVIIFAEPESAPRSDCHTPSLCYGIWLDHRTNGAQVTIGDREISIG